MPKKTFLNLPKEKQEIILKAAQNEFARHGFDLASIQRIVEASGISRGSCYQYFEDKTDILITVLRRLRDNKLEFMAPILAMKDDLGYFDFLELAVKAGFEYARKEPQAYQIVRELYISKTLNTNEILKVMGDEALDDMGLDASTLYVKPIKNSIVGGEMTDTYPPEFISAFTQLLLQAAGEILMSKNIKDPLGAAGEKLYDDFINILKYGLYKRNIKKTEGDCNADD